MTHFLKVCCLTQGFIRHRCLSTSLAPNLSLAFQIILGATRGSPQCWRNLAGLNFLQNLANVKKLTAIEHRISIFGHYVTFTQKQEQFLQFFRTLWSRTTHYWTRRVSFHFYALIIRSFHLDKKPDIHQSRQFQGLGPKTGHLSMAL